MKEHSKNIEQVAQEVIGVIVEAVNLRHLDRTKIGLATPLARDGLGLDSIDILEVVVAIEHHFGVKLRDPSLGPKYFSTIGTVAEFVLTGGTS